jgi:hypothetical protein
MIKDYLLTSNIGVLAMNDTTVQEIYQNSGPLANANEFQVHYWALVLRQKFADNSIVDICIPTVFYNYKQEVTSAHIDFDLKDVEEMSKALEPVHNVEVNKLKTLLKDFPNATLLSVPFNSIHKHPGGRNQGFSGTDLNKDSKTNTGVVFPLASADIQPNFASILCVTDKCYVAHSEYRIANGDASKEGINYYKGRSTARVFGRTTPSKAEEAFGISVESTTYSSNDFSVPIRIHEALNTICENYRASTDFVKPENVTKAIPKPVGVQEPLSLLGYPTNSYAKDYYTPEEIAAVKEEYKIDLLPLDDLHDLSLTEIKNLYIKYSKALDPTVHVTREELHTVNSDDLQLLQDDMVFEATCGDTSSYDSNFIHLSLDDEDDEDMNYIRNTLAGLGFQKDYLNTLDKDYLDKLYTTHFL